MDENHETNNRQSTETPANTRKYRFIGSFSHGLDAKGRLVIPQPFREKLGEEFYIAPSFDFKSIAIYPTEKWEERSAQFEGRNQLSPELNAVKNFFYALSYDGQTCDGQGRVLLPANIRQKILGEERDVEITGANDHILINAAAASADNWAQFLNNLPSMLETIAGLRNPEEKE
ncbi:MAG: hypothetical protein IJL36_08980 [Clostridia bacterium]|nr:hypothetical protein [Clostridia bacterium]